MGIPSKVRFFGQYVQFCQPIDWSYVAPKVKEAGYNGFVAHTLSAWGMLPEHTPWIFNQARQQFNLGTPNPTYASHVDSFVENFMVQQKMNISICFTDAYYQTKWIDNGAAKLHPFRNNVNGVRWGDDDLSLPESKPWFTHVSWKTEGHVFNEKVTEYEIHPKYKWLWDYIRLWGETIKRHWKVGRPTVFVRFINENHAKFDANGNHQGGFGGEDKIFQIVRKEFEKLGLEYGKAFVIVNDWMPFRGTEFLLDEWVTAGRFDRHPNQMMFREVHGCDEDINRQLDGAAVRTPALAGRQFVLRSTDGLRPENNQFIGRCFAIYGRGDRLIDIKVPSERAVTLSPLLAPADRNKIIYFDKDYMKTFDAVLPTMRAIAGVS